eukprot:TRINITY_DN967_c0_g1_i11.p1 TRINITY_DN967_c0_g1~~TRINITY_DN967_c0_g1_i11.p1  ORF type:complete len:650 (-),score=100.52 TRINITY_DN967_c0_g1_i11:469-2394(-)
MGVTRRAYQAQYTKSIKFCTAIRATMVCANNVRRILLMLFGLIYCCEASKLRKIITETCADADSFTYDTTYIELYGGNSAPCRATFPYSEWTTRNNKQVKISKGSALGECERFEYVSSNALSARVVWEHSLGSGNSFLLGYDAVQMCSVVLEFGDVNKTNEVYIWNGKAWAEGNVGAFLKFYKQEKQQFYLDHITAKVCSDYYSGTDDTVYVELDDGRKKCRTGNLDTFWGNEWATGSTETLRDNLVEDCKFLNANADKLRARIVFDHMQDGWALGYDGIQLCNLKVQFQSYTTNMSKVFNWNGAQWWEEHEMDENTKHILLWRSNLGTINWPWDSPIDKVIAPNSYSAKVIKHLSPWNDNLHGSSKSFDTISPQMVFRGVNPADPPTIISWSDLKNGHENGEFHSFVRQRLSNVLMNAKKIILVAHGWKDGDIHHCEDTWVSGLASKIGAFENEEPDLEQPVPTATVAVCWNSSPLPNFPQIDSVGKICWIFYELAPFAYYQNACTTAKMGELLAKLITAMKDEFANIEYVHGIGHSLGAHLMGNIYNFGGVKLERLSGLDPAGPCFEGSSRDIQIVGRSWGVTKDSAFFVDNIHTDGGYYGTYQSKGHLDFLQAIQVFLILEVTFNLHAGLAHLDVATL